MPRKAPPSLADRYRAAREAMELSLQLRITPAEATEVLARRKAAEKAREAQARLNARINGHPRTDPIPPQWWNRDLD